MSRDQQNVKNFSVPPHNSVPPKGKNPEKFSVGGGGTLFSSTEYTLNYNYNLLQNFVFVNMMEVSCFTNFRSLILNRAIIFESIGQFLHRRKFLSFWVKNCIIL